MRQLLLGLGCVVCLVLLAGCGSKSYDAWLPTETVVMDDRLAGVWRADFFVGENEEPQLESFLIVTIHYPEEEEEPTGPEPVYYKVAVYWDESLRGQDSEGGRLGEVDPTCYYAALHEVDGTLFLQALGYTDHEVPYQLVTPFHLIYKVAGPDAEQMLRLHPLEMQGWNEESLREAGLLVRYEGEGQYLFFSETKDLEAFIRAHQAEEGFFNPSPEIVLKRISDTSGQFPGAPEEEVEMETTEDPEAANY